MKALLQPCTPIFQSTALQLGPHERMQLRNVYHRPHDPAADDCSGAQYVLQCILALSPCDNHYQEEDGLQSNKTGSDAEECACSAHSSSYTFDRQSLICVLMQC